MAMVLDSFISRFSGHLIQLVEEKASMLMGVDDEIQKLQSTLEKISNFVEDAERRKIRDKSVDRWLKKLRDAMYDADDILDLCRIDAEKYSPESKPSKTARLPCLTLPTCFRNPVFANDIGKRIRSLNVMLEELSNDTYGFFNLSHSLPDDDGRVSEISERTSSIVESDLVGTNIRGDTRKLVRLITRRDPRENVLVFAIVGMGGIGKTTLAQLVFNDDVVKGHFPLRLWVSVSKSFDENDLLRTLITSANGDLSGAISRNQLETKLLDTVKGNKFLLVIDDVWDEHVWDRLLRNPLRSGAAGSSVIVTSRTDWVARQMKAVYCHRVNILSPEDGWSLLCKKLVLSGREEEIAHLKDIGLKIVEKCEGLPLAIKAMGAILCTKSRRDWESVLRSTAWSVSGLPEQVNKALYLSYLHLPSDLKQCFMYCSLLPKGYEIQREEIVQLWIAEGFIKDQGGLSISMEETGERFFRELVWRNLLQHNHGHFPFYSYKMHDLLRSLAGFLAQEESLHIEAHMGLSSKNNRSTKLRRLSIAGGEIQLDVFRKKESLRTLILFHNQSKHLVGVLDHLPFLRVLKLNGSNIEELPDSLTCLPHLRYLGLQRTHIRSLPENIGKLKNLQFLNLFECKKLDRLPNSITHLINLRSLNIILTGIKGIPAGIRSLRHLSDLHGYILSSLEEGEGKWSTLEDLGPLLKLRQLAIMNLERASPCSAMRATALAEKSELNFLNLSCTPGWLDEATEADIRRTEEVFEVLQPPSAVECLRILGFPGKRFPNWMMAPMFSNLGSLILFGCKYLDILPPFGQLPKLFSLRIYDLPSINSIGPEFIGAGGGQHSSTFIPFPELQELIFNFMPSWEKWLLEKDSQAMPSLQKFKLSNCPKLISLPVGLAHATTLTEIMIRNADSLETVGNFDSLQELDIAYCSSLERVFDLPALEKLFVIECPSLNMVENLVSIKFIGLSDYKMDSLPEWLCETKKSPKPEKLIIFCKRQLFETICQMGEEEWPKIEHINYVEIICNNGEARAFYSKEPFSFTATPLASTSGPLV